MSSVTVKPKTAIINYEEHVGDTLFMRWNWSVPDANGVNQTVDLTNYYSKLQIKTQKTDLTPLLTLTSNTAEGIVLGGNTTNINVIVSAEQTANLGVGLFFYDCQMTDTLGYVNTLIEGKIKLVQDTTR